MIEKVFEDGLSMSARGADTSVGQRERRQSRGNTPGDLLIVDRIELIHDGVNHLLQLRGDTGTLDPSKQHAFCICPSQLNRADKSDRERTIGKLEHDLGGTKA